MDEAVKLAWKLARPTADHGFETACVAPWVSIEFDPSGWVYACCTSGLYPLGRIGEQRIGELWGGPRAQVLRESLRRYDLTVACGPCKWHLEHGRLDPVAAVYDQYEVSSEEPERPYMMLFALSNRCNLGCIMCSPELSTKLRTEAGLPALVSPYDDQFFEDLEPFLADLKLAKFLGGEPFLAPEHKRIWELMDRLSVPPRMQITTNGTIWNDYVDWLMNRFEVDISISIDAATAGTYEEIRRGGDFAELLANVEKFSRKCREKESEFHVSYCLMNRNWFELGSFLLWAEQFDVPASVNLVTDEGLAIHDEPLEMLLEIAEAWAAEDVELDAALHKNRGVWATQRAQLASVIAERHAGVTPSPRQAQRVPAEVFERGPVGVSGPRSRFGRGRRRRADAAAVSEHAGRLERWSCGGPVGILAIDVTGRVAAVTRPHERLGLESRLLTGQPVTEVVEIMEMAMGRPAWVVESGELDDCVALTLAFARDQPIRGTTGSLVRTLQVPQSEGWVLLCAEDRIYDTDVEQVATVGATPVTLGARVAADGS